MCNCQSILECCVIFSGVKLSIKSFNLFLNIHCRIVSQIFSKIVKLTNAMTIIPITV